MQKFDVLIVGGGPAGLQSAMMLGRAGRRVLLCDDDRPRNLRAKEMHYFPTREGITPAEFRKNFKKDLTRYPKIEVRERGVVTIQRKEVGFQAQLSDQSVVEFRKLILAMGVEDILPDIPGVKELWGRSLFHCPFCHGYEFKDQVVGIWGDGDFAYMMAAIMKGLTPHLTIFSDGPSLLTPDQRLHLGAHKIAIVEDKINRLKNDDDVLKSLVLEGGREISLHGLLFRPPQKPRSSFAEELGCQKNDLGFYIIDSMGRSTVQDVFIAGDPVDMRQSALTAAFTGMVAAVGANHEIAEEDLQVPGQKF